MVINDNSGLHKLWLGVSTCTKFDEFSENFRMGGGGVISDPKNFVAVFSKILGR